MGMVNAIKQKTPWPIRHLSRKVKRAIRQTLDARRSCKVSVR
jgi:hypothetical protein